MTEKEWLTSAAPVQLLEYLDRPQGDRKLFLFALACCRAIWPLLPQPEMRGAVAIAEDFAEGKATAEELDAADWRLEGTLYGGVEYYANRPDLPLPETIARWLADVQAIPAADLRAMACCGEEDLPADLMALLKDAGYFADFVVCMNTSIPHSPSYHQSRFLRVALIRDVFGNPFRPVASDAYSLFWNAGTIPKLAETIYADRAFDRLPVLADALEEAGCTDAAILEHCRGPGPHVRGCWVVDLLLEKT